MTFLRYLLIFHEKSFHFLFNFDKKRILKDVLIVGLLFFIDIVFLFGHVVNSGFHHGNDFANSINMILGFIVLRFN